MCSSTSGLCGLVATTRCLLKRRSECSLTNTLQTAQTFGHHTRVLWACWCLLDWVHCWLEHISQVDIDSGGCSLMIFGAGSFMDYSNSRCHSCLGWMTLAQPPLMTMSPFGPNLVMNHCSDDDKSVDCNCNSRCSSMKKRPPPVSHISCFPQSQVIELDPTDSPKTCALLP